MLIYDQPDDLNDDLIDPIWEYRHNEDGFGSITGGYVYRGEEAPSLYGKYIFTDYMFGEIWALDIENKSVESIYNTSSQGPQPIRIPGFGITSSNELYFADRTSGSIYKFKENIGGTVFIENVFPDLSFNLPIGYFNSGEDSDKHFVVEQKGLIYQIINNSSNIFLDISNTVNSKDWEQGLLSLAFHPNYSSNSEFFVTYTSSDNSLILSRFIDRGNPDDTVLTEEKVMTIQQTQTQHNGGNIIFGTDNYLYFGIGDDGEPSDKYGNAQNLETLKGSLLRIDINNKSKNMNYSIPSDNPFYGNFNSYREEIWAYGFRNPWKFSIDINSGEFLLADVGQYEWEEINSIKKGGNYGWAFREGTHCFKSSKGVTSTYSVYTHNYCDFSDDYLVREIIYNMLTISLVVTLGSLGASNILFSGKIDYMSIGLISFSIIFAIFWYLKTYSPDSTWRLVDMTEQFLTLGGLFLGFVFSTIIFIIMSRLNLPKIFITN